MGSSLDTLGTEDESAHAIWPPQRLSSPANGGGGDAYHSDAKSLERGREGREMGDISFEARWTQEENKNPSRAEERRSQDGVDRAGDASVGMPDGGSACRAVARVTALLCVRPRQRALFQTRRGPPIRETGRSGSNPISSDVEPVQGEYTQVPHIPSRSGGDPLVITPWLTNHNRDLETSLGLAKWAGRQLRA